MNDHGGDATASITWTFMSLAPRQSRLPYVDGRIPDCISLKRGLIWCMDDETKKKSTQATWLMGKHSPSRHLLSHSLEPIIVIPILIYIVRVSLRRKWSARQAKACRFLPRSTASAHSPTQHLIGSQYARSLIEDTRLGHRTYLPFIA